MSTTISPSNVLLSLGAAGIAWGLWRLTYATVIGPLTSSLRYLPGPISPSFFYGHAKEMIANDSIVLQEEFTAKYGSTIAYKGLFNSDRFYTTDPRALNHILTHSTIYQKPDATRFGLSQIFGEGLLVSEDDNHRKQRRIMNPAFGPSQIRGVTHIFVEKAIQLRELWTIQIAGFGEPARLDVLKGLTQATLDVIGLAGFNYDFDSLNVHGRPNELSTAYETVFNSLMSSSIMQFIMDRYSILRFIPSRRRWRIREARRVVRSIGIQLVAEKKAAVMKEFEGESKESGFQGRDLLTLLIKANMSAEVPENQRLSDEEVLAQVPTFLVAGHETTSNATTWCLFALAKALHIQAKLREELVAVDTDTPDMDELNALPYLDMVVKETMRVHAPVVSTIRVAAHDDVVPLGTPIVDKRGEVLDSIKIDKGHMVVIPILAMNRSKALWGEDAYEFKPERWEHLPASVSGVPGVWSHLMTFIGGPRACIGYRFSLVEMKALLFTLIRAFEFELAIPAEDISRRYAVVQRPIVQYEVEKGSQLPLLVKPHRKT